MTLLFLGIEESEGHSNQVKVAALISKLIHSVANETLYEETDTVMFAFNEFIKEMNPTMRHIFDTLSSKVKEKKGKAFRRKSLDRIGSFKIQNALYSMEKTSPHSPHIFDFAFKRSTQINEKMKECLHSKSPLVKPPPRVVALISKLHKMYLSHNLAEMGEEERVLPNKKFTLYSSKKSSRNNRSPQSSPRISVRSSMILERKTLDFGEKSNEKNNVQVAEKREKLKEQLLSVRRKQFNESQQAKVSPSASPLTPTLPPLHVTQHTEPNTPVLDLSGNLSQEMIGTSPTDSFISFSAISKLIDDESEEEKAVVSRKKKSRGSLEKKQISRKTKSDTVQSKKEKRKTINVSSFFNPSEKKNSPLKESKKSLENLPIVSTNMPSTAITLQPQTILGSSINEKEKEKEKPNRLKSHSFSRLSISKISLPTSKNFVRKQRSSDQIEKRDSARVTINPVLEHHNRIELLKTVSQVEDPSVRKRIRSIVSRWNGEEN